MSFLFFVSQADSERKINHNKSVCVQGGKNNIGITNLNRPNLENDSQDHKMKIQALMHKFYSE